MSKVLEGSTAGPTRGVNPGSQGALRHRNQQRVTDVLLTTGPATQAELSRQTGLSTATISNIVKRLEAKGVLKTSSVTSSGRRALLVSLVDSGAVAVGVDFGRRHVRIVLSNLGYEVIAEDHRTLARGHRAEEAMQLAVEMLDGLLESAGIERSSILGVGVGIPGTLERSTGTILHGDILPEWVGTNRADLAERFGLPVIMDNDANLGALAEVTWGAHRGVSNLVFVKVGTGIGAGLILNGSLFYGSRGVTGEIGHTSVAENGLVCYCGNRGCLETVASASVMIESLARGHHRPVSADDIVALGIAGDSATARVVEDAGMAVGHALANIANVINPEVFVVGGPLTGLEDLLLDPIRRGLERNSVPVVRESTGLSMSSLGMRAEALGAAALVLQESNIRRV